MRARLSGSGLLRLRKSCCTARFTVSLLGVLSEYACVTKSLQLRGSQALALPRYDNNRSTQARALPCRRGTPPVDWRSVRHRRWPIAFLPEESFASELLGCTHRRDAENAENSMSGGAPPPPTQRRGYSPRGRTDNVVFIVPGHAPPGDDESGGEVGVRTLDHSDSFSCFAAKKPRYFAE
jgi:hypothetical protein